MLTIGVSPGHLLIGAHLRDQPYDIQGACGLKKKLFVSEITQEESRSSSGFPQKFIVHWTCMS